MSTPISVTTQVVYSAPADTTSGCVADQTSDASYYGLAANGAPGYSARTVIVGLAFRVNTDGWTRISAMTYCDFVDLYNPALYRMVYDPQTNDATQPYIANFAGQSKTPFSTSPIGNNDGGDFVVATADAGFAFSRLGWSRTWRLEQMSFTSRNPYTGFSGAGGPATGGCCVNGADPCNTGRCITTGCGSDQCTGSAGGCAFANPPSPGTGWFINDIVWSYATPSGYSQGVRQVHTLVMCNLTQASTTGFAVNQDNCCNTSVNSWERALCLNSGIVLNNTLCPGGTGTSTSTGTSATGTGTGTSASGTGTGTSATGTGTSSSDSSLIIGIVVGVIVVLGILAFVIARARKPKTPPVATAAAQPLPPPGYPGYPPPPPGYGYPPPPPPSSPSPTPSPGR
jgi:hypothetical protein